MAPSEMPRGSSRSDRSPMSRFSLRFEDPDLERAYVEERWSRYLASETRAAFAGTALLWAVIALIFAASPDTRGTFAPAAVFNAIILFIAGLLVRPAFARVLPLITVIGAVIPGLSMVIGHALWRTWFDPIAAPNLAIYIIAVHAFMGLRFVQANAVSMLLAVAFAIAAAIAGRGWHALMFEMLFVGGALVFGMQISRRDERYKRRQFDQSRRLRAEQERSERLLLNVLPPPIAERLKAGSKVIADSFDVATVLFADIVGFTVMSSRIPPTELVAMLDTIFTAFDEIAERHGLEKIKTIGDAYMVVGGLPSPRDDHAIAVAAMALEMRAAIERVLPATGLSMRVGIHTGPVVAGVIGRRKYIYDLWGDTVNTASRMESHGLPGEIQISEATRLALGDAAVVEERGMVDVKGKGPMRTFWLRDRRV